MNIKIWQFLNSKVEYQNNNFSWQGVIANEIRHLIYKNLREDGISINSHGVKFVNKCIFYYLDQIQKAVYKEYNKAVIDLIANKGI